ncbi:hypothetical protein [Luteolibacter sp. Populi]|uniref:hypothetical protein n=1 Tax=Luteolibacter sp. Populi TaxID=3230487 RepID=UPI003465AF92
MISPRIHQRLLAFTLPAGWFLTPIVANAQSTWVGTTTADWATPGNWVPSGIPGDGANIVIADVTAAGSANTLNLDISRNIGSLSYGVPATPRLTAFLLQTNANTLTIGGGLTASANFAALGPTMRGSYTLSADQIWTVAGAAGAFGDDRGVMVRGPNDTAAAVPSGTFTLNGTLTKAGSGQLSLLGLNVTGAGNIVVNEGALKLNAGGNQGLTLGGRATSP